MGGFGCSACEAGNYPQRYLIHTISLCQTQVNDVTITQKCSKILMYSRCCDHDNFFHLCINELSLYPLNLKAINESPK